MAARTTPNPSVTAGDEPVAAAPAVELQIFEPLCSVFRRKLKSEGLKYTPERAQLLDTVIRLSGALEGDGAPSGLFEADRVLAEVKKSGFRVSKATVYRTMRLLQEAGIIQRVPFDDEQTHYQLAYGVRAADLVIRTDTRRVTSVDVPELIQLRDALCARLGLRAVGHRFHIFATAE